ncbi:MAG TPA: hypothetical protein VMZ74_13345 [Ramlibacter sp.]|nr:hypothetical protein [Ramlibacter sp.]
MSHARTFVIPAALAFASSVAAECAAPEYHQFDFWVGEWTVTVPGGREAGVNRITREYDGCVVHERYTTARGYTGESLNIWDATRRVWHQTWVDNTGTLLLLEGRLAGASMVLEGAGSDEGRAVRHRITWTPNADGTVRQLWETTAADGSWKATFDGTYRRKTP